LTLNFWPVGTGPFMLVEQGPNRYVMERNPNYRGERYPSEGAPGDREKGLLADAGKPMPFVDRIVSTIEKERQSNLGKVIQGWYDAPFIERPDNGPEFLQAVNDKTGRWQEIVDHGLQLPSTIEPNSWYMGFNWLDPVVGKGDTPEQQERNRKLRQAISIATDWEEHVEVFSDIYGPSQVAMGPLPPGVFGHKGGEAGVNPVTHRWVDGRAQRRSLDEAKRLLAEAGYPDGRDAKTGRPLVLYYDVNGTGPGYQARHEWQVKQIRKLGIQLELRNTEYNRFQERMRKGNAQVFFWGWLADYPDPENFLFMLESAQSKVKFDGENSANYSNPEYDQLAARMKDLPDGPERQAVIDRMVEIVRHDSPWMFGIFPGATSVHQSWVHNGKPTIIVRNTLQYLRVDPAERTAKLAEWNKPRFWPLLAVPVAIALLAWAALRIWRRREAASARDTVANGY
jgi:ABC-type transport system substrate-binding protein